MAPVPDHRQTWISLFRKFAHLYDSGVPLAQAVELVRAELGGPLEEPLGDVVSDLYAGASFADAVERRAGAAIGPTAIGILRAGEELGELGRAARSAADGMESGVVAVSAGGGFDLDAWLAAVAGARAVHIDPGGRVRLRVGDALEEGPPTPTAPLLDALGARAGLADGAERGAFVWRNRLCRYALLGFSSAVLRLSAEPGPEPPEARAWREGAPDLLRLAVGPGEDADSRLRAALGGFDRDRCRIVAIDLPAPETTPVPDWDVALDADPDVIVLGRPPTPADRRAIARARARAIHVLTVVY